MVTGGWEGGNGELLLNGYRVSVWGDGKISWSRLHNIVNALPATAYILKMVKMANFMLHIFYHN